MSNQIQSISNPKLKLEVLSDANVQKIHEATLRILENVGVKFPSRKALEIWAQAGAQVDFDTHDRQGEA